MLEVAGMDRWRAGGLAAAGLLAFASGLLSITWFGSTYWAQGAITSLDPSVRHEFKDPLTLASKDGVLEVRLTAQQGEASLDTVATPVQNFLLLRLRGDPGHGIERAEDRKASISRADLAGLSG